MWDNQKQQKSCFSFMSFSEQLGNIWWQVYHFATPGYFVLLGDQIRKTSVGRCFVGFPNCIYSFLDWMYYTQSWRRSVVTSPLWGESHGHRRIHLTRGRECGILMFSFFFHKLSIDQDTWTFHCFDSNITGIFVFINAIWCTAKNFVCFGKA